MATYLKCVVAAVVWGTACLSLHAADAAVLFDQFKDLGAPEPEKRKAAREKVVQARLDAPPVLLAMLSPKQSTDESTRIGVLRALADSPPLTDQAAQTLAWTAVHDKYPEVRREACAAIRHLQDDRAVREVLRFGFAQDTNVRRAAAGALREIDDPRALATLVRGIPTPDVTANVTGPNGPLQPSLTVPAGPFGARLPLFLPRGEVSGTASDIGSPFVDLLRLIAGKDFGTLPPGWLNWYREKIGDIGAAERDQYRRSLRERMNLPP